MRSQHYRDLCCYFSLKALLRVVFQHATPLTAGTDGEKHVLLFPNFYILKCFILLAYEDAQRITVGALGPGDLVFCHGEAGRDHSKEREEDSSDTLQRSAS